MIIATKIFFLIFAGLFFLGAVGEKEEKKAFMYVIAATINAVLLLVSIALL